MNTSCSVDSDCSCLETQGADARTADAASSQRYRASWLLLMPPALGAYSSAQQLQHQRGRAASKVVDPTATNCTRTSCTAAAAARASQSGMVDLSRQGAAPAEPATITAAGKQMPATPAATTTTAAT